MAALCFLVSGWVSGLLTAWWWDDRCERQLEAEARREVAGRLRPGAVHVLPSLHQGPRDSGSKDTDIPCGRDHADTECAEVHGERPGALASLDVTLPMGGSVIAPEAAPCRCTCTLTHRCAACRDGLVDGYGAWRSL